MKENFSFRSFRSLRRKVAREAAELLYTLQEKEYKQAKERAMKDLGARIIPTNMEVAEELDMIAEEHEGESRYERLIQMRKDALEIMEALNIFHPKLVGSVWRGTAHRNSDIDVTVFSSGTNQVLNKLQEKSFKITKREFISTAKRGEKRVYFHIILHLSSGNEAEIVVRNPEEADQEVRCEIYGDVMRGLNINHLKTVLNENPLQRFVPERKTSTSIDV